MRIGKYRLWSTLLLAGALYHTGCGSMESKADVMEADVQQTDLPEDSADSGSDGDSGITPQESDQNSVLPPLSTEAQTIDYKGSVPVDWLTASSDAIYLLSRDQDGGSGILKMKPGEADGKTGHFRICKEGGLLPPYDRSGRERGYLPVHPGRWNSSSGF